MVCVCVLGGWGELGMTDRGGLRTGVKMKGNLIDEKEEQEKGVAVKERSTLETKKCGARPSERHGGISGASFDEGGLEMHPHLLQSCRRCDS